MTNNLTRGDTRLILDECRLQGLLRNQSAYVLATAWHETAHTMKPVRETLASSDALAKSRLTKAWKSGKMPQVKADYWSGGFFGRGYVQLTHKSNYERAGKAIGVDLVRNPSKALEPAIAAAVMVRGMMGGWFGKALGQFVTMTKSDYRGARKSVNGTDKAALIASYAREYEALLLADGYGVEAVKEPERPQPTPVKSEPQAESESLSRSKRFQTWLVALFGGGGGGVLGALGLLDWRAQMFLSAAVIAVGTYAIVTMPAFRKKLGLE